MTPREDGLAFAAKYPDPHGELTAGKSISKVRYGFVMELWYQAGLRAAKHKPADRPHFLSGVHDGIALRA